MGEKRIPKKDPRGERGRETEQGEREEGLVRLSLLNSMIPNPHSRSTGECSLGPDQQAEELVAELSRRMTCTHEFRSHMLISEQL